MSTFQKISIGVAAVLALIALPFLALALKPTIFLPVVNWVLEDRTAVKLEVEELTIDFFPLTFRAQDLAIIDLNSPKNQTIFRAYTSITTIDIKSYLNSKPGWWSATVSDASLYTVGKLLVEVEGGDIEHDTKASQTTRSANDVKPDNLSNADSKPVRRNNSKVSSGYQFLSFREINIENLVFNRQLPSENLKLTVNSLQLRKQKDEKLFINFKGQYRDEPLNAEGVLALPKSDRAQEVKFTANILGNTLDMDGKVGHDGITPGKANFTLDVQNLQELSRLLDYDLSRFSPLRASGILHAPSPKQWSFELSGELGERSFSVDVSSSAEKDAYIIENLDARFGRSNIKGDAKLNVERQVVQANLVSDSVDISQLLGSFQSRKQSGKTSDRELRLAWLQPWKVDVSFKADRLSYQNFFLSKLALNLSDQDKQLVIDAEVGKLVRFVEDASRQEMGDRYLAGTGKSEDDNFESDNNSSVAWDLAESTILKVKTALVDISDKGGLPASISFETAGLRASFDGLIPQVFTLDASNNASEAMQLKGDLLVDVDTFESLSGFDRKRWDAFLPASLSLSARTEGAKINFDKLRLELADDILSGSLTIDRSQAKPYIAGDLQTSLIDINRFGMTTAKVVQGKGEKIDQNSGDIIGDTPINWSWLEAFSADLKLAVDTLKFNQTNFYDLKANVELKNGELNAKPIGARLKDGVVEGDLKIAKTQRAALMSSRFFIEDLRPADLGLKNEGLIDGGRTNLSFDLRTVGATPQELASQLDGEIVFEVRKALIRNGLFEVIGSDLVMQTVNLINPFTKTRDTTDLKCAAAHISVREGVLKSHDKIIVETENMRIRGDAEVNLNDETLRIDFSSSARKGLGLSLGKLSSAVRIDGTLGKPKVVADPQGIVGTGARIGAAIATSGLSWLAEGLFERFASAGTDCGKIFEKTTQDLNASGNN